VPNDVDGTCGWVVVKGGWDGGSVGHEVGVGRRKVVGNEDRDGGGAVGEGGEEVGVGSGRRLGQTSK
jgi:hypothetical protein